MDRLDVCNYWDDFEQRVADTVAGNPRLSRLTLHITEGCNLHCAYCNTRQSTKTMPQETVEGIIEQFSDYGGGTIHFTGGEPTIVPYLQDMVGYANECGLSVSLNTNAVAYMDVSRVRKVKASLDTVDRLLMERITGRDIMPAVHRNLTAYSRETGGILSITALAAKQTFRAMPSFAREVVETYHPYNLYFTVYKGDNPAFQMNSQDVEELFAVQIPETLDYFRVTEQDYSARQLSIYSPSDFMPGDRFAVNRHTPCSIHLSEMTISPDGMCYDCSHLYRDKASPRSVPLTTLAESFDSLKAYPLGVPASPACLTGCNPNLCAFNATVCRLQFQSASRLADSSTRR